MQWTDPAKAEEKEDRIAILRAKPHGPDVDWLLDELYRSRHELERARSLLRDLLAEIEKCLE